MNSVCISQCQSLRYTPLPGKRLVEGEMFIPVPNVSNLLFKPDNAKNNKENNLSHATNDKPNTIDFTLTLNSGSALAKLKSLNHTVMIDQKSQGKFVMQLRDHPLDKDFELVWQYPEQAVPQILNFNDDYKNKRYGLLMILPSTKPAVHNQARQLTFVLDKSGSMAGQSMEQAKLAFKHALKTLASNDTFQLIIFNDKAAQFFENPVAATEFNKNTAWQHVSSLRANGGTEIKSALTLALAPSSLKTEVSDKSRLEQIVFLTDGAVGNEAEIFTLINKNIQHKRLFTIGLGTAPNRYFMKRAAEAGRGSFQFIGSHKQLVPEMTKLFNKLDNPLLTNIHFNLKEVNNVISTSPNPIPDLYHGEPIFLSYQLDTESTERPNKGHNNDKKSASQPALINAKYQGKVWNLTVDLNERIQSEELMGTAVADNLSQHTQSDKTFAKAPIPALATLWARRKIDDHYRELMLHRNGTAKQSIIDLALSFNLVTPYTSLVAVENVVSRPNHLKATSKQLKNNLPAGQSMPKTALNWQWQLTIALTCILIALSFLTLSHYFRLSFGSPTPVNRKSAYNSPLKSASNERNKFKFKFKFKFKHNLS